MELTDEQVKQLIRTIDSLDGVVAQVRLPRPDTLAILQLVGTARAILQPSAPTEPSTPPQ